MDYEPMKNSDLDSETNKELNMFKKKVEKQNNPIRKIILNAVKTVVITIATKMLPILLIGTIVTVLIVGFQNILDDDSDETGTDEEFDSSVSDSTGGTDITSEVWQLSRAQIQDFIENYDSTDNALKQKMLDRIDDIYNWQSDCGYSAGLLITIAFEEGISADEFDNFLNEMNEKASKWKDEGYTAIEQIVKDYVGDDTAKEWANNIENKMQETAREADIIKAGEEDTSTSGDGYNSVYTSKSGKTYKNYKQNMGSYSNQRWCGDSIIKNDGCSLISVCIILSGYQNREIDPLALARQYAVPGAGMSIDGALSGNGITFTRVGDVTFSEAQKNGVKQHVATGKPAIIKVVKPSPFTTSQHYMAILDYNESTNEFYLSNPWYGNNSYGKTGWVNADEVLYMCTRSYAIN